MPLTETFKVLCSQVIVPISSSAAMADEVETLFKECIEALKKTFGEDRDPTPEELKEITDMPLRECKAVIKQYQEARDAEVPARKRAKKESTPKAAEPTPNAPEPAKPSLADPLQNLHGTPEIDDIIPSSPPDQEVPDRQDSKEPLETKVEAEPSHVRPLERALSFGEALSEAGSQDTEAWWFIFFAVVVPLWNLCTCPSELGNYPGRSLPLRLCGSQFRPGQSKLGTFVLHVHI